MNDFIKKPRREPMGLQLTAMIDIFSIICIFLILGTVMGTTDIVLPGNPFSLPESTSKESMNTAPQLVISDSEVQFPSLQLRMNTSTFVDDSTGAVSEMTKLSADLKTYLSTLPESAKSSGVLLNVVADEKVPYDKLFAVLKVFREAGFESLLFVTQPKKKVKS